VPAFMVLNESGRAREPVHLPFAPGAIHLRAAEHPWGRAAANGGGWSSPQPVLTRNAVAAYLACGDEGPEGLPGCQPEVEPNGALDLTSALAGKPELAGKCLGGEVVHAVQDQLSGNPIGRLYGVNVIDDWTEDLGNGEAEIYWNASTWNPYQVVLIKTRLKR
jgi:hypothetical protein